MPDRSIICAVYASPPIQYLVGVVAYLFDGHVMGARALLYLYVINVGAKVVAESRKSLMESGKERPDSDDVICAVSTLAAWRKGYLSLHVFYNKFLQRVAIWAVILWAAMVMHDAYPDMGWTKYAVGFLLACELRAIAGNLGDCGIERAKMIRQFIDQALEAILRAKVQDLGRALMGLGSTVFGIGSYSPPIRPPSESDKRINPRDREGDE